MVQLPEVVNLKIKECARAFVKSLDKQFASRLEKAYTVYREQGGTGSRVRILLDMRLAFISQRILPLHYVTFRFYEKSTRERSAYISGRDENRLYFGRSKSDFPAGKYERYLLLKPFFQREIQVLQPREEDQEIYDDFCSRHETFVVKPVIGKKGQGVAKLQAADVQNVTDLEPYSDGGCLLEEAIRQGEELAKFHPSSINTVRFATAMSADGKFTPLFALFRTGRGGSVVDNVGSGGLISLIDIRSGTIATDGLHNRKYFTEHPDTGVTFKDARIPCWEELCLLVQQMHAVIPDQRLVGWDFAWTADGHWDLVEANPRPSFVSYQTLADKGIRPLLREAGIL